MVMSDWSSDVCSSDLNVKRIVGARLHAGLAADAALVVEVDDTVGATKKRNRRADLDARRVVAVIAAQHGEVAPRVWVLPFLDVLHPSTIHAERDVVLFFARHRAGVAADAAVLIDEKSVAHFEPFRSTNLAIAIEGFDSDTRKIQVGSIEWTINLERLAAKNLARRSRNRIK